MKNLIKEQLRIQMKDQLASMGKEEKIRLDSQIMQKLKNLLSALSSNWSLQYGEAPIVGMYVPLDGEPDIREILSWEYFRPSFPVLKNADLRLMEYSRYNGKFWDSTLSDYFLKEEKPRYCLPDYVIIPGLMYDKKGNRLGRGKGYFDTYLNQHECYSIGVCYSFQIREKIETQDHDKNVSLIVTDNEVIKIKNNHFLKF